MFEVLAVLFLLLIIIAPIVLIVVAIRMIIKKSKTKSEKVSSKTGVFVVNNSRLSTMDVLPKDGSINSIAESLGYTGHSFHTIIPHNFDKIDVLAVKMSSQTPIFVLSKNKQPLSLLDLEECISKIDWAFESEQMIFTLTHTGEEIEKLAKG